MGFWLVPTSMTLNLEQRTSPYFAFFLPNSIALQVNYVTTYNVRKYCLPVPVFHFWPKLTHSGTAAVLISAFRKFNEYSICITIISIEYEITNDVH